MRSPRRDRLFGEMTPDRTGADNTMQLKTTRTTFRSNASNLRSRCRAPARRHDDYTDPVSLPRYLTEKAEPNVCALSEGAAYYDYVASGGTLPLGTWLDTAARQVNR